MLRVLIRTFSKKDILKNELLTNPFFQRAFPHISRNNDHKLVDKFIEDSKELLRERGQSDETDSVEELISKFKTEKYYKGIKVKEKINPKNPEKYRDINEIFGQEDSDNSEGLEKAQGLSSENESDEASESEDPSLKSELDSQSKSLSSDDEGSAEIARKMKIVIAELEAKKERMDKGEFEESGDNAAELGSDLSVSMSESSEETPKTEKDEFTSTDDFDKHDPDNKSVAGWGDTLFFRKVKPPMTDHDIEEQTDKTFIEGYRTIPGPLKWLPEKEKERIHAQIDLKMDQLEDTGLSRQEILLNKPGGIPLSQDPVFQYLRRNRLAREMLVKQGEEFTAYKVVDYALRQDFGPDLANVAPITPIYEDEAEASYMLNVRNQQRYPQLIEPRDYYWKEDIEGKKAKQTKYFESRELLVRNPVETRGKYIKKNIRNISRKDIHFKNTEFLAQFMTDSGFILNRLQTRLPEKVQRKVARTIKHARCLHLLPIRGFILPVHKQNLVPMFSQNFQDIAIHCETGAVFSKFFKGGVSKMNTEEHPNTIDKIAKRFKLDNHTEDLKGNIKKAKKFINYDIQFFPNKKQVDILEAHQNLKTKQPVDETVEENLVSSAKRLNSYDFHEGFIYENAANLELYKEKESVSTDLTVEQGLSLLKELKSKFGVKEDFTPAFYKKLTEEKPYKNSIN